VLATDAIVGLVAVTSMYGHDRVDPPVGQAGVVALTAVDWADSPALLTALTRKAYAVLADSPVTVAEVPVTVAATVVPR
jgi:hypothetical protein